MVGFPKMLAASALTLTTMITIGGAVPVVHSDITKEPLTIHSLPGGYTPTPVPDFPTAVTSAEPGREAAVIDAKHHHGGNHATYTPAWQVMGHGPRSPIIPTPMPDDPGFHGDPKIDFHGPVVVPTSETSNPKWPGGVGPVGATLHQTMSGEPSAVPAISGPYGAPLSVTGLPHPVITSAAVFWGQRKADGIDTLTTAYQTPPGRVDAKRAAEACHVTTLYGAQDQITTTICDQPPATCTPCVGCNAPQC